MFANYQQYIRDGYILLFKLMHTEGILFTGKFFELINKRFSSTVAVLQANCTIYPIQISTRSLPGVETTAWKFFSCRLSILSDFSFDSFSSPRTLCTYWLLRNFRSAFSCSNFLRDAFSSEI